MTILQLVDKYPNPAGELMLAVIIGIVVIFLSAIYHFRRHP